MDFEIIKSELAKKKNCLLNEIPEKFFRIPEIIDDEGNISFTVESDDDKPRVIIAATKKVPFFIDSTWAAIIQDCDGFSCDRQALVAKFLKIKENLFPKLSRIVNEEFTEEATEHWEIKKYRGLDMGASRPDTYFEDLSRYKNMLSEINLTFNGQIKLIQALYPIDCTNENFKVLTGYDYDIELTEHLRNYYGLWIFILGQNCD